MRAGHDDAHLRSRLSTIKLMMCKKGYVMFCGISFYFFFSFRTRPYGAEGLSMCHYQLTSVLLPSCQPNQPARVAGIETLRVTSLFCRLVGSLQPCLYNS